MEGQFIVFTIAVRFGERLDFENTRRLELVLEHIGDLGSVRSFVRSSLWELKRKTMIWTDWDFDFKWDMIDLGLDFFSACFVMFGLLAVFWFILKGG